MIEYKEWKLSNGLNVVLNVDKNTPLVAVNLMYDVGAKNENANRTGMAHLFEHLMFSGSKNAPNYDQLLQKAGGENNAFTSNDLTNYYVTLPKENLELALWLEADRMCDLNLDQNSLDVQKKVVIEEFKQRYFNQPYGDVWLKLRPLCYKKHPYQWPTIGKSIEQIEAVSLSDAQNFYRQFYSPNNCTLSISGNVSQSTVENLVEQYFGDKPAAEIKRPSYEWESIQSQKRQSTITADVPFDAIYMAFPVEAKNERGYHLADVLTDILSGGSSSRFYYSLVKEQQLFGEISAYLTGETEPGLLVISGKLSEKTSFEQAEKAVWKEIELLITNGLEENELEKVINKKLTAEVYSELQILNKAIKLAFFKNQGILEEVNNTMATFRSLQEKEIIEYAVSHLQESKCNLLHYCKAKKS